MVSFLVGLSCYELSYVVWERLGLSDQLCEISVDLLIKKYRPNILDNKSG